MRGLVVSLPSGVVSSVGNIATSKTSPMVVEVLVVCSNGTW